MQGNVPQILFAVLLLGILAPVLYIHITRSQKLLKRWADENRYEFLHVEHRMFRKGPFAFSSRGQSVYRVEVRDEQGIERKGWVRCGSWWAGVLSDQVEARWDEQ
jgi:hypothetical protein